MQISQHGRDVIITIRILANAHKNLIVGWENGILKIRISAIREKGRANEALREFLSDTFDIAKSRIEILAGFTNTTKRIKIENISIEAIIQSINSLIGSSKR